ncbi:MAG: hypothetical protein FRX48_09729 [Lasallia pustulata]|uniref:Uncharacterized protein n=1 Tax=Lasallia pustulata TaxID=136370 RepID=A0A5M8PBZ4_9LECA|nr:MAG: hypothetical protein FRX48_09729 [Lasallia pustulata]
MPNKWAKVKAAILQRGYQKLLRPTVVLHKTAYPKTQPELERLGVRFDFAGTVEEDGKKLHRFQVQDGTHGIVATIKVPDNGTKEDVEAALNAVDEDVD